LETDQLEAFDRVVREGSFSRAAIALGIGQPAVSARIQSLETALGGAVLTRGRTIALTALGESFLPYARRVLGVLREGMESSRMAQTGKRGRITFGSLGSLAGGLVGPALVRFVRDHPDVEYVVKAADQEVVVEMLLDGIVDLALVTWPGVQHAGDLVPVFSFAEPVVLVAHPNHPLAKCRSVSEEDVARLARPLLRLRWWPRHHAWITQLAERSGTSMELPMEAARRVVLEGMGAGFFARTYVADALAEGTVVAIGIAGVPPLRREIALVLRRSAGLSPAGAEWLEALRAQVKRLGLSIKGARPRGRH
jgi:DNA-binding transcriptional LysR family regulator